MAQLLEAILGVPWLHEFQIKMGGITPFSLALDSAQACYTSELAIETL